MVSSLSGLKLQAIYRIALSFETSEITPHPTPRTHTTITIPTQLSNNQSQHPYEQLDIQNFAT
jgi:hypothetical protein